MSQIRVMIADDHPLIIEGLVAAIGLHGIKVVNHVGASGDVAQGFEESKPDVLVLDVRFADGDTGLEVAHALLARSPDARIVFYSQFDQDEIIRASYRLGCSAFVTKNVAPSILADAIKQAHAGKKFFLPEIAERLALLGLRGDDSPQSRLNARELQVFKCMAQGHTNLEIADEMKLSLKTISNISQSVKENLGIHRPGEITRLAIKHRLIQP